MSTTRIFGNNPFEVYLKPTNKISISSTSVEGNITVGTVVTYKPELNQGNLVVVPANAGIRQLSSVLG